MRADNGGEFWHVIAGAVIGGLVSAATSAITQYLLEDKVDWDEVIISAVVGAGTGALTASGVPLYVLAPASAVSGAAESVYSDLKDGKETGEIIGNAIVSAGVNALFSCMGEPSKALNKMYAANKGATKKLITGGLNPKAKNEALKIIKSYYNALGRYMVSEFGDNAFYSGTSALFGESVKGILASVGGW